MRTTVLISSREAEAYGPRLEAALAHGFIPKRELSGAALAGEEVAVGEADPGG